MYEWIFIDKWNVLGSLGFFNGRIFFFYNFVRIFVLSLFRFVYGI